MHIAICDDNIADRKQTERLMGREADVWIKEGKPLYIYTYGSLDSLIANFMQFDAVLIDNTETGDKDTIASINRLRELGFESNYIITSASINEDNPDIPENAEVLCKPLKVEGLHQMLVKVEEKKDPYDVKIELRGEKETIYARQEDILYAKRDSFFTEVTLANDTKIRIHDSIFSLFDSITELHPCFVLLGNKAIVNAGYVEAIKLGKVVMSDGNIFSVSHLEKKKIMSQIEASEE